MLFRRRVCHGFPRSASKRRIDSCRSCRSISAALDASIGDSGIRPQFLVSSRHSLSRGSQREGLGAVQVRSRSALTIRGGIVENAVRN
jgi:hypothetical protein